MQPASNLRRRCRAAAVILAAQLGAACGPTVAEEVHRAGLSEQRAEYEERIRRMHEEARRAVASADRTAGAAEARAASLETRVARLEEALSAKERALNGLEARVMSPDQKRRGPERGPAKEVVAALSAALSAEVSAEQARVFAAGDEAVARINGGVWFAEGSPRLLESGRPAIVRLAQVIRAHPAYQIQIDAHTEVLDAAQDQDLADSWALTGRQAAEVARALREEGVDPSRIVPRAFGHYLSSGGNERVDTRVEVRLSPR